MLKRFENKGLGWVCLVCSSNVAEQDARLMTEGESESKSTEMSQAGRAKWQDKNRTALECRDCGQTELIEPD